MRTDQPASNLPTALLSETEAAELLTVSHRTLQGWRVTGEGPAFVKISRRIVRYRLEDLQRYLEERTFRSTNQIPDETG